MYNINMKSLERFFLSRKTVLVFIVLILASIVVGYVFPQRFLVSDFDVKQWKLDNPFWAPMYDSFGLDHVYSTKWFTLILFLFLISLIVSTMDQIVISKRKTFGKRVYSSGNAFMTEKAIHETEKEIRANGYLLTYRGEGEVRFVKHPWGYWGNVLLHLGIVFAVLASLTAALTQRRGASDFIEQKLYEPGFQWQGEETGLLAQPLVLPGAVRLDSLKLEFWETDNLKDVTARVSIIGAEGAEASYPLAINRTGNHEGVRIYQGVRYGDAFYIVLKDKKGNEENLILTIGKPSRRDKPGYHNFTISDSAYILKAKYFADAEKNKMVSDNPLLVLRLVKGSGVVGELPLLKGGEGMLGPYEVELVHVSRWSQIIFTKVPGMAGIFIGFFIIIAGSMLTYFTSPREFHVKEQGGALQVSWIATRFEVFYRDEFYQMKERIAGGVKHG